MGFKLPCRGNPGKVPGPPPRRFTRWRAGGGTDDFCCNIVKDPDFDHDRLTVRWQGLDAKPTGVESAKVIPALLA